MGHELPIGAFEVMERAGFVIDHAGHTQPVVEPRALGGQRRGYALDKCA